MFVYILSSSSSCRAGSTDIPDPSRHFSLSFIYIIDAVNELEDIYTPFWVSNIYIYKHTYS